MMRQGVARYGLVRISQRTMKVSRIGLGWLRWAVESRGGAGLGPVRSGVERSAGGRRVE